MDGCAENSLGLPYDKNDHDKQNRSGGHAYAQFFLAQLVLILTGLVQLLGALGHADGRVLHVRFDRIDGHALFVHQGTQFLVNFVDTDNVFLRPVNVFTDITDIIYNNIPPALVLTALAPRVHADQSLLACAFVWDHDCCQSCRRICPIDCYCCCCDSNRAVWQCGSCLHVPRGKPFSPSQRSFSGQPGRQRISKSVSSNSYQIKHVVTWKAFRADVNSSTSRSRWIFRWRSLLKTSSLRRVSVSFTNFWV